MIKLSAVYRGDPERNIYFRPISSPALYFFPELCSSMLNTTHQVLILPTQMYFKDGTEQMTGLEEFFLEVIVGSIYGKSQVFFKQRALCTNPSVLLHSHSDAYFKPTLKVFFPHETSITKEYIPAFS